jgi:hypothetical protein
MSFFDGRIGATTGDTKGVSTSTQSAAVNFIPSATGPTSPPIVSVYPAGQGLQTLNSALPASAAYLSSTYGGASSAAPALTTLLLLAGAGVAAWYFLRKR